MNLDNDLCGDITSANPLYPVITITTECLDPDGDGKLNLPYCTSWDKTTGVFAMAHLMRTLEHRSKCKCDIGFTVNIDVPPAPLGVEKTVDANGDTIFSDSESIPEPGGSVTYQVIGNQRVSLLLSYPQQPD